MAAAKVGASTLSVGPVTADGKDLATGQANPALSDKLLKTAFGLGANGDSDVEQDTDKGEYYAVHVDQIQPPRLATLGDPGIRPALTQLYGRQIVIAELQKKASAATAAIGKGQSFETAAAAAGGRVTHQVGLERVNAQQYRQSLGDEFLDRSSRPRRVRPSSPARRRSGGWWSGASTRSGRPIRGTSPP